MSNGLRFWKGSFKAGDAHRLRKSKLPIGSGNPYATPVLQYMDHIQKKVGDLNRREVAFMDQPKENATQDEGEDEADVCTLSCQKRSTITACSLW